MGYDEEYDTVKLLLFPNALFVTLAQRFNLISNKAKNLSLSEKIKKLHLIKIFNQLPANLFYEMLQTKLSKLERSFKLFNVLFL